ncbi:MAG: hypothetical protein V5B07_06820, partial [Candidatus Accumulibacter sp. UW27]
IKENVGRWLLAGAATARRLKSLMKEIAMDLQKLVPDRTNPHKPQPKPHLSHAHSCTSLHLPSLREEASPILSFLYQASRFGAATCQNQ